MNRLYATAGLAAIALCTLFAACNGNSDDVVGTQSPLLASPATSTFGLTADADFYTVDTGAGLVFKIRRSDNGSNTQSPGDIASLLYKGVEYQDPSRGSQLNSGADYLYKGISAVDVRADAIGSDIIKITVTSGGLTHYYIAKSGNPHIYMGTTFSREPDTLNLVRFIVRVPIHVLPKGPAPSDIRGNIGAIEAGDIFGMPNGETRSKHYSNMRLMDWSYIGATSNSVGLWMVRDNQEGGSGGPFYRSLLNQATASNQELTYIVNYGEAQTEAFRTGILNTYTLAFMDGGVAPGAIDTSWFGDLGLVGYIGPSGRGRVAGVGIAGRDSRYTYTVGFSNARAQYWVIADADTGHFDSPGMIPGVYTMTLYKNELAVLTSNVTVTAGGIQALHTRTIVDDPSQVAVLWRIGNWDGTPREFINGSKLTTMHPGDVRMSSWRTAPYVVGTSSPATGFPAYQWKSVNGAITVKFDLTAKQIANRILRVGTTTAYANARPQIKLNGWSSATPPAPIQPDTRTLTVGTYRGNNVTFRYAIPASAFVVGTNTMTINVSSGSSGVGFLSPGYAYDAVDLM